MFSPKGYTDLISSILAMGYRFVTPGDFDLDSPEKQVILRHDVDYSPQKALELAKLDHSLGVCSTFFFLVRGHWYNFLGHYTQDAVHKIHAMGFPIGLHYAPPLHIEDDHRSHCQQLLRDFSLMHSEFSHVYSAFSWHVPPPLALQQGRFHAPDGIVDMYSDRYFHQVKYVSDSSLRNSCEYLNKVFLSGEHDKVQLVLHAECWLGSREMVSLADLMGEILRAVIEDGEMDFREKSLLPLGIPLQVLDQVTTLFVNAAQVQGQHSLHK